MQDELVGLKETLDRRLSRVLMDDVAVRRVTIGVFVRAEGDTRRVPAVGIAAGASLCAVIVLCMLMLSADAGTVGQGRFAGFPSASGAAVRVAQHASTGAQPYPDILPEPLREPLNIETVSQPKSGQGVRAVLPSVKAATAEDGSLRIYPVSLGAKRGFIDSTGRYVVQPILDEVGKFIDGVSIVRINNASGVRCALLHTNGAMTDFEFGQIRGFSEGIAAAQDVSTRAWGFIDRNGTWAVEPIYTWVSDCVGGMAEVILSDMTFAIRSDGSRVTDDPDAETRSMPIALATAPPKAQELRVVENRMGTRVLCGVSDAQGNVVVPPVCRTVTLFTGGIIYSTDSADPRYGVFDAGGSVMLMHRYGYLGVLEGTQNALAARPADQSLYGVIGLDGEWIIEPKYARVEFFDGVLARVRESTNTGFRHGYVDLHGEWISTDDDW